MALAHVLPMPVLSLCAARLYHASRVHAVAAEKAEAEAEARRKQDEKDAIARRRQEDADAEARRTQELRDAEVARLLRKQEEDDALRLEEVARNQKWREAELERQARNQEEEDRLHIENAREDAKLARWQAAQQVKAQLRPAVAQSADRGEGATVAATARTVIYEGVEYPTVQAAADVHGISRQAMAKRLAKARGEQ